MPKLPAEDSGHLAVDGELVYQGHVSFEAQGTTGLKNPRVWVFAEQQGNVVWGAGCAPGEVIKLGGDSSLWVHSGGGPADCVAQLYYILGEHGGEWSGHGAQTGTVTLAQIEFLVDG